MVKQFNTLSSLSSPQSLLLHVLASASTNRLIDPKWNTELINTVLMRVCCSITCHLNHPAQVLQAIRFLSYTAHLTNLLCHFRRSRNYHKHLPVLTMSTPQCRVITPVRLLFISFVTFYPMLKIGAFLLPPILTMVYSYILNEVSWMSQMKSKCNPID